MSLQTFIVLLLTWPTRTWFLTKMKSLSPPILISPLFVNRKSTKLLSILSTESIKLPSRQWSGPQSPGRTSSWSKDSSSTAFSQQRNLRPQSRKCWTSSSLPTTFTCTLLPQPASTNGVIHSRMHSRTSIASYYPTQGLVEVHIFHSLFPALVLNSLRFRRFWATSRQWIRRKKTASCKLLPECQSVV